MLVLSQAHVPQIQSNGRTGVGGRGIRLHPRRAVAVAPPRRLVLRTAVVREIFVPLRSMTSLAGAAPAHSSRTAAVREIFVPSCPPIPSLAASAPPQSLAQYVRRTAVVRKIIVWVQPFPIPATPPKSAPARSSRTAVVREVFVPVPIPSLAAPASARCFASPRPSPRHPALLLNFAETAFVTGWKPAIPAQATAAHVLPKSERSRPVHGE